MGTAPRRLRLRDSCWLARPPASRRPLQAGAPHANACDFCWLVQSLRLHAVGDVKIALRARQTLRHQCALLPLEQTAAIGDRGNKAHSRHGGQHIRAPIRY